MMSGFRPGLVPTLITVPTLIVLICLGFWQLDRREQKATLIERVESRMDLDPVPLPAQIHDPDVWDYRPVTVTGRYVHDQEMYLFGRTYQRTPGIHVITPLEREDGAGVVLVNRGWVPLQRQAPETRPASQPKGRVTLTAIARMPVSAVNWATPDNDLVTNSWFWIDLPAMARFADVAAAVQPVYLEVRAGESGDPLPVGGQTRIDFPNNHLQYALTWFGCAVALLVIYVLSQTKAGGPRRGQAGR